VTVGTSCVGCDGSPTMSRVHAMWTPIAANMRST
jgi:hypothetical protein